MNELIWSQQGMRWKSKSKVGDSRYHVVGLYFDGNTITAAGELCGEKKTDKKRFQLKYEAVWKGIDGFYVPTSQMIFQCREGVTYGDVCSRYFSNVAVQMRKKLPEGVLIAAISIPERQIWSQSKQAYIDLLEQAFGRECKDIFPVLVSLPQACALQNYNSRKVLFLSIERDWTEFYVFDKQESAYKTAAAFGYIEGQRLDSPMAVRLNDYQNNSTAWWKGRTFDSWSHGFREIWESVCSEYMTEDMDVTVVCPETVWETVKGLMTTGRKIRASRIGEPACCIEHFVKLQLSGELLKEDRKKFLSRQSDTGDSLWEL